MYSFYGAHAISALPIGFLALTMSLEHMSLERSDGWEGGSR